MALEGCDRGSAGWDVLVWNEKRGEGVGSIWGGELEVPGKCLMGCWSCGSGREHVSRFPVGWGVGIVF